MRAQPVDATPSNRLSRQYIHLKNPIVRLCSIRPSRVVFGLNPCEQPLVFEPPASSKLLLCRPIKTTCAGRILIATFDQDTCPLRDTPRPFHWRPICPAISYGPSFEPGERRHYAGNPFRPRLACVWIPLPRCYPGRAIFTTARNKAAQQNCGT